MAILGLLAGVRPLAADEATLLRLFLQDGTSLVSYGEFARVADRVVFSLPTAATPNPPLQLVNIPASRIDWERTNRYADSARAARYADSQAEDDYVVLSNEVGRTLNEVAFTTDAAKRLAIVEDARKTLAAWPQNHFNYRLGEVRQMLSLLDETIADLKAAGGGGRFELSLVAVAPPPDSSEPLLPPPSPIESIEGLVTAAQLSDVPAERRTLLNAALAGIDRDAASLPRGWAAAIRAKAKSAVDLDDRIDRSYDSMVKRLTTVASQRARLADVRGITRVLEALMKNDEALGRQRPDTVTAAVQTVQAQLDAARRLRLVRDRWAIRAPTLRQYSAAVAVPLGAFKTLQEPLADIKELAGSTQASLLLIERQAARVLKQLQAITPPEEARAVHAVLVSAAHLAENAARIRREATLAGDITRAWDASSAAAGALMLGARAKADMQALLRPPQAQ